MKDTVSAANDIKFCHLIVAGLPYTEAYRRAYGADSHPNEAALKQAAHRKAHNPQIVEIVNDLKAVLADGSGVTAEMILAHKQLALEIAKKASPKKPNEYCRQAHTIDSITSEIAKVCGLYHEPAKGGDMLDHRGEMPDFAQAIRRAKLEGAENKPNGNGAA